MRAERGPRLLAVVAALVTGLAAAGCDGEATGPAPVLLEVTSGQAQEGLAGWSLPDSVTLRTVDASGNAVAGARVELSASHGGSVRPPVVTSGPTGRVRTAWTLGTDPGAQELRALPEAGEALTVDARALPLSAADRVILRGALAPPKGIVLVHDLLHGTEVVTEAATPDTVILLQPREDRTSLVVFPTANALEWRDVAWTTGPDTVVVELRPPVAVDVQVRVFVAPFDSLASVARADLARTDTLWRKVGMGIRLGDVEILDRVEPGRTVNATADGACSSPAREQVELSYVHLVRNHPRAGQGCPPGQAFVSAEASGPYPWLTAHELGHTFALRHRGPGLMDPSNAQPYLTEGQIYRANFDIRSGLNVLFDAHPEAARRLCSSSLVGCLDSGYELGGR